MTHFTVDTLVVWLGLARRDLMWAFCIASVTALAAASGCSYTEPEIGVLVHIRNPHCSSFNVSVDGQHAGTLESNGSMMVRITPEQHKIVVEDALFIPAVVFWYWDIKTAHWPVDGTPYRETVDARLAGLEPMPCTADNADIPLVLDKYYRKKGWFFFIVF